MESSGDDKADLELVRKKELGDNSEFAAFKRWLVRDSEAYAQKQPPSVLRKLGGRF